RIKGTHRVIAGAKVSVELEKQGDRKSRDANTAGALEEDHRTRQTLLGDEVSVGERNQRRRRDVKRGQKILEVRPELVAGCVDDEPVAEDQGKAPDREKGEQREGAKEGQAGLASLDTGAAQEDPAPGPPHGPDDQPRELELADRRPREHDRLEQVIGGHREQEDSRGELGGRCWTTHAL